MPLIRARVPAVAIHAAARRMEIPTVDEGFDAVYQVAAEGGAFTVQPALL